VLLSVDILQARFINYIIRGSLTQTNANDADVPN